jgi:hypothetical protein
MPKLQMMKQQHLITNWDCIWEKNLEVKFYGVALQHIHHFSSRGSRWQLLCLPNNYSSTSNIQGNLQML